MFGNMFDSPLSSYSDSVVMALSRNPFSGPRPNAEYLQHLSEILSSLNSSTKIAVVMGEDSLVSGLNSAADSLNAPSTIKKESVLDSSFASAEELVSFLPKAFPSVLSSFSEAFGAWKKNQIAVFSLSLPGLSVEAVASLLAEYLQSSLIFVSELEGITGRKGKSKKVKLQNLLSHDDLLDISLEEAGSEEMQFDPLAALVLHRSKTKAFFLSHENLSELENAAKGLEFKGTKVE